MRTHSLHSTEPERHPDLSPQYTAMRAACAGFQGSDPGTSLFSKAGSRLNQAPDSRRDLSASNRATVLGSDAPIAAEVPQHPAFLDKSWPVPTTDSDTNREWLMCPRRADRRDVPRLGTAQSIPIRCAGSLRRAELTSSKPLAFARAVNRQLSVSRCQQIGIAVKSPHAVGTPPENGKGVSGEPPGRRAISRGHTNVELRPRIGKRARHHDLFVLPAAVHADLLSHRLKRIEELVQPKRRPPGRQKDHVLRHQRSNSVEIPCVRRPKPRLLQLSDFRLVRHVSFTSYSRRTTHREVGTDVETPPHAAHRCDPQLPAASHPGPDVSRHCPEKSMRRLASIRFFHDTASIVPGRRFRIPAPERCPKRGRGQFPAGTADPLHPPTVASCFRLSP